MFDPDGKKSRCVNAAFPDCTKAFAGHLLPPFIFPPTILLSSLNRNENTLSIPSNCDKGACASNPYLLHLPRGGGVTTVRDHTWVEAY